MGQKTPLTIGADTFNGTAGNDTFTAAQTTGVTWTVGDAIDGGAGADTFNVTQTAAITTPVGTTVKNIETANLLSGTTANVIDTTSWTGLTALNVTGVTAQTVTAAATTDVTVTGSTATGATAINGGKNVTVTETGAAAGTVNIGATTAAVGTVTVTSTGSTAGGTTGNGITVKGGTDISITQKGGNAVNTTNTDGAVVVTGTAATKTVTVVSDKAATAAATVVGRVNGTVGITDVNAASATAAGAIETVSVTNAGAVTVNSGALKTLNLGGTITSVNAGTLGALTTAANTALAVNVNGLTTTGAVTVDTDITTLNLAGNTAASTIANLSAAGAKSINVSGDAKVAVSANTLTALTDITVTNTAGFQLAGTAINTGATFTGGAGDDAVVLGATTKAITMGAGNDKVTSAGLVGTGGSVAAGDGTDTIVMTFAEADAADASATFNSKFTGFEVLELDASAMGANGAVNLVGINGVNSVTTGAASHVLTLDNFATGGTLKLTADAGAGSYVANVANAVFNPADTLNLNLSKSTVLAAGSVTAAGVETLNITAADANTTTTSAAVKHTLTLVAADATTVNVSGNNGLTLTSTAVKLTTFDASGVVANSTSTVIDTAANLAVTFTSTNTDATKAITIKGGAGNDVLAGNAAVANTNTITGGEGADQITTGLGNDTFVLTETTAAVDTVVFATAAIGGNVNGLDTITGFQAGAGTTTDKAKLVAAATTNAAQDVAGVADFASVSVAQTSGAQAYVLGASTATNDILEITTTLSSFGNLGAAGVVDGSELLKALSSTNVAASSFTTSTAGDDFYMVAYQNGNAYLYQVTDAGADTTVVAADIALVGVFNGVAAGAFAAGDFTV